jgi:3-hydroxymyristoyl/3-hydroxydecanoyl-(acyl carrier protein) dehydratase
MADRIKKVVVGIATFFTGERLVIDKEKIISILPHRGRMLLLDEVMITGKKVVGKFTVTEEVCQGHEFNNQLVFRGVDIIEMAAQLLGIWLAQHPESEGKIAFLRRLLGDVKFFGMVIPLDVLIIEIPVREENGEIREKDDMGNPRIEILSKPNRLIGKAVAEDIVAKVDKTLKASIAGIELSIVSKQSLAK